MEKKMEKGIGERMTGLQISVKELIEAHETVLKVRELNSKRSYDQQFQVVLNAINALLMDTIKEDYFKNLTEEEFEEVDTELEEIENAWSQSLKTRGHRVC